MMTLACTVYFLRHSQMFTKHKRCKHANNSFAAYATILFILYQTPFRLHGWVVRPPCSCLVRKAFGKASDQEGRCYKNNIEFICVYFLKRETTNFNILPRNKLSAIHCSTARTYCHVMTSWVTAPGLEKHSRLSGQRPGRRNGSLEL